TRATGGLTRRINILADKALLAAFTRNAHAVTPREVRAAIHDAEFARTRPARRPALFAGAALAAGVALGVLVPWLLADPGPAPSPVSPPAAEAPSPAAEPATTAAAVLPAAPAPASLSESEPPASKLTGDQLLRLTGYSPEGQPLLAARLEASRAALQRTPDDAYTIELYITDNADPARMERFLTRARDLV